MDERKITYAQISPQLYGTQQYSLKEPATNQTRKITSFYVRFLALSFAFMFCGRMFHEVVATNSTDKNNLAFDIYCRGPILQAIQNARIFVDSKEFVDMPMSADPREILSQFDALPDLSKDSLVSFVNKYFLPAGSDLVEVDLRDFTERPKFLDTFTNEDLRRWAIDIHKLWAKLGRKPIIHDQERHSLLKTRFPLVVPGGRFRETYYWDSYWIIQGLLISGMTETALGVVMNLLDHVERYGFVPNGGRIYYLNRSQPPLLSAMVYHLFENKVTDRAFIEMATSLLDKEYAFWMKMGSDGHAVEILHKRKTHILNRYHSTSTSPRPESYREDQRTAAHFPSELKYMLFQEITSAAESGWDFSGRWFQDKMTLTTIHTSEIIPVELNAFLFNMEHNLANLHQYLGNSEKSSQYRLAAFRRKRAMDAILWSQEDGMWFDYSTKTSKHTRVQSISNFTPLWANCYDTANEAIILAAFKSSGLIQVGGVQTTTLRTGQQWDGPNAWPPLQDLIVEGLLHMNSREAHSLARSLVRRWIHTGFTAWNRTHHMYEKYNATRLGALGGGGEYALQVGFGWSNAVMLKFLTKYNSNFNSN